MGVTGGMHRALTKRDPALGFIGSAAVIFKFLIFEQGSCIFISQGAYFWLYAQKSMGPDTENLQRALGQPLGLNVPTCTISQGDGRSHQHRIHGTWATSLVRTSHGKDFDGDRTWDSDWGDLVPGRASE